MTKAAWSRLEREGRLPHPHRIGSVAGAVNLNASQLIELVYPSTQQLGGDLAVGS